jgi:hypothetical protein
MPKSNRIILEWLGVRFCVSIFVGEVTVPLLEVLFWGICLTWSFCSVCFSMLSVVLICSKFVGNSSLVVCYHYLKYKYLCYYFCESLLNHLTLLCHQLRLHEIQEKTKIMFCSVLCQFSQLMHIKTKYQRLRIFG